MGFLTAHDAVDPWRYACERAYDPMAMVLDAGSSRRLIRRRPDER